MTVQESVGGEGVRDVPVMEDILAQPPSVYAVGRAYRIMVPVRVETLCWCEVGGESYEDESCGILRSSSLTHAVTVPMEALDRAGGYTLCFRVVRQRKPYFSEVSETIRLEVPFRPLPEGRIRLFMVADAHNRIAAPVAAAGRPDLLVLNGDVPEDSGRLENFTTIHAIAGQVTRGEVPTVFARGNHDLRGVCAERLAEHTPTQDGRSYYTFRLGTLWGIVLDCGEDKSDDHAEYGHTICCHAFRRRETAFLREVVVHADEEYAAAGVTPIGLGNYDAWPGAFWYCYLASRLGGTALFERAAAGDGADFAAAPFVRAGEMLRALVEGGAFSRDGAERKEDEARKLFVRGKSAMYLGGSWLVGQIVRDPDAAPFLKGLTALPFPEVPGAAPDGAKTVLGGVNCGFSVASSSREAYAILLKGVGMQPYYDQYLPAALTVVHKNTTRDLFAGRLTPQQAAERMRDEAKK